MTIARGNSVAPLHLISATFPRSGRDTTACDRCDDGIDRRERDFPFVSARERKAMAIRKKWQMANYHKLTIHSFCLQYCTFVAASADHYDACHLIGATAVTHVD